MTIPNKFPVICAALAAVAATSAGFAQSTVEIYSGTVSLSQVSNASGGDGEFTAFGLPVPSGYTSTAIYNGSGGPALETFCVEDSTFFWQSNAFGGSSFAVNYSESIQIPLGGASLSPTDNQGAPYTTVALNPDVAWLYAQFATGSFAPSLAIGLGNNGNAGSLQDAIWELQGGAADPAHQTIDESNLYVQAAQAAVPDGATASTYDVEVMNLYLWGGNVSISDYNPYGYGGNAGSGAGDYVASSIYQNQLIYTGPSTPPNNPPVPDGGATMALFGAALIGLGFGVSRRRLVTTA